MTLTTIKPAGLSKPVDLADNEKIRLGTGNDLEIYHNGTANYIKGVNNQFIYLGTNNTNRWSISNDGHIRPEANQTYDIGSTTQQVKQVYAKEFLVLDNGYFKVGTLADLQIFHNGQDSFIRNSTGVLKIQTGTENAITASINGAVELYYDNEKRFETLASGAKFSECNYIDLLAKEGQEAAIYVFADQGDDNADKWRIRANTSGNYYLENKASGSWETNYKATGDGAVELYYDNSKKFETTSNGISVGSVTIDSTFNNIGLPDSGQARFGNGEDLRIFHSSGENFIRGSGSASPLYIDCCENLHIRHLDTNGSNSETMIKAVGDGAVELYHDNSKKLTTTSTGIDINTGGSDGGSSIKIYGHDTIKRNNWGYSTAYKGIQIGRSDSNVNSSIFMGVDPSSNTSGAFGGYGNEMIFRNDLSFYHPNNANDNWKTFMRTGRFADTGAACFPNGLGFGSDTSTDNVMDDYEEGTFTPTNGTVGLNSANGRYTKIGNVVTFHLRAVFANNSSAVAAYIDGLPYNSAANWGGSYPHSCTIGYATGNHIQFALLSGSSDRIYLYDKQGNSVQLTHFDNDDVRIGGSYIVA